MFEDITIEDMSPPEVDISVDGILERSFNENIVIDSTFSDNWGVSMVEWLLDGAVQSTFEADFESARVRIHIPFGGRIRNPHNHPQSNGSLRDVFGRYRFHPTIRFHPQSPEFLTTP